jgi:N-acetylmuramoyl-L-alanine amidase-like
MVGLSVKMMQMRGVVNMTLIRTAVLLGLVSVAGGCTQGSDDPAEARATVEAAYDPTTAPNSDADWKIVVEQARWAYSQRLDTLPIGEIVARIGQNFLGTRYTPRTLEVPGEERLVVELEELDCVTFVENVLALARLVQRAPVGILSEERVYKAFYSGILTNIRYRGGRMDGYASRLHYFSEWITDNEAMGMLRHISGELGGVPDGEPVTFMTTHPDAYRQLREDPSLLESVRVTEEALSAQPRIYIPEQNIAAIADQIEDGDIIAATSTIEGLDVAHTGIALWVDGELRLLNAPLVGDSVQISELPLAERILGKTSQDGIMVARPLDVRR